MKRLLLALTVLAAPLVLAGCPESDVGRSCVAGAASAGAGGAAIINSQALECNSRICFRPASAAGGTPKDMCTDFCGGSGDCNDGPQENCKNGFACSVAVTVGPFCCKKLCVCKDYLSITDAGIVRPEACNPDNPANRCPNIR